MGSDKEGTGCDEKEEEDGRGESFVREVCKWGDYFEDGVMEGAEVIHAVLQVTHVAEKILGHFGGRPDGAGWGERRAVEGIGAVNYGGWGRWMTEEVGGDHTEEESSC